MSALTIFSFCFVLKKKANKARKETSDVIKCFDIVLIFEIFVCDVFKFHVQFFVFFSFNDTRKKNVDNLFPSFTFSILDRLAENEEKLLGRK